MGDNRLTLQQNFYEWLKTDSKISPSEIEGIDAKEAASKFKSEYQAYLQSIGINEESMVESDIDLENEENNIFNEKFDDYISGLSKDDTAFQVLDKNKDGRISSTEKVNFFESMNSSRKKDFNVSDFDNFISKFEEDFANSKTDEANPFLNTSEIQETKNISEIADTDFPKINLEVTTVEQVQEQLNLVDEQLSFYNENSQATDMYLDACKSVFDDAKGAFESKREELGVNDSKIDASLNNIANVDKTILTQENNLKNIANSLSEANNTYNKPGLSESAKNRVQEIIKELIEQLETQERIIDELYEKQNENYQNLSEIIAANDELKSSLYFTSKTLAASYIEYSDMKSCQNRITGQKPSLEASKDVLKERLL